MSVLTRPFAVLAGLIVLVAACGDASVVEGDGVIVEVTRDLDAAHRLEIDADLDVRVVFKQGAPTLIVLTTDANLADLVRTTVEDGTLRVETESPVAPTGGQLLIVLATLDHLEVTQGHVEVTGEIEPAELRIEASGSASVSVVDLRSFLSPVGTLRASARDRATIDAGGLAVATSSAGPSSPRRTRAGEPVTSTTPRPCSRWRQPGRAATASPARRSRRQPCQRGRSRRIGSCSMAVRFRR